MMPKKPVPPFNRYSRPAILAVFLPSLLFAHDSRLRYLPPYSPDLNPIEAAYSAFKTFLRKCAERTEEALRRRAGQFVRRLQPEACANFFVHAGYTAT